MGLLDQVESELSPLGTDIQLGGRDRGVGMTGAWVTGAGQESQL